MISIWFFFLFYAKSHKGFQSQMNVDFLLPDPTNQFSHFNMFCHLEPHSSFPYNNLAAVI